MKTITLLFILLFAFQIFAQQQKTTMDFSVLDKNKIFDGELKDSDIEIKQGKNKLEIISVDKITNERLDIVLMIDVSGSQEKTLEAGKSVAIKFVENIIKNDKDRLAVVKFAQSVDVEQDFSSDIPKLINTIKSIEIPKLGKRNTSIWDSVQKVAETLAKIPTNNKKAIVLISDGLDNTSKTKLDDVAKYLMKLQIPVYSIRSRDDFFSAGNFFGIEGYLNLELISKQTGGLPLFPENDGELQIAISQIEQSLRKNFKVTFLADNLKSNDKIQKVEILIVNPTLKTAKLKVIQPKGFFYSAIK